MYIVLAHEISFHIALNFYYIFLRILITSILMLYFKLASFIAVVSSTVIELNTTSQGFVIPYRVASSDQLLTIPIVTVYDGYSVLFPAGPSARRELTLTTVDNDRVIVEDLSAAVSNAMIASFDSTFATQIARTYMMIPMHRQLVVNPSNPRDFVYGGQLETIRSTSDRFLKVRVSVEILDSEQDAQTQVFNPPVSTPENVYDFTIATGFDEILVPELIMQALSDEIQRRGIVPVRVSRRSFMFASSNTISLDIPGDVTDDLIDSLPTIQFCIHTDSGNRLFIRMYGRDYVGSIVSGRRQLLVRSSSTTNGRGFFGRHFVSKIALFVDNENRTIGFGEPL